MLERKPASLERAGEGRNVLRGKPDFSLSKKEREILTEEVKIRRYLLMTDSKFQREEWVSESWEWTGNGIRKGRVQSHMGLRVHGVKDALGF